MNVSPPPTPTQSRWTPLRILAGSIAAIICVTMLNVVLLPFLFHSTRNKHSRSLESKNNVKHQALAVTNYYTRDGALPPHGKPPAPDAAPVSWMTAMLPMMDERRLYESIDFAEPFDAPANEAAFSKRIYSYVYPGEDEHLANGLAAAHYAGNELVFVPDLTLDGIGQADGVTQTLMIGEVNVDTGVPTAWGNPSNLRSAASPINGPTGFGANGPGGIVVGFCDGRATLISADIDPAVFKALGTPDGGEEINDW
ncbi:MAG: DUF1559 domain-containing protein [Planctomycetota bacterium]